MKTVVGIIKYHGLGRQLYKIELQSRQVVPKMKPEFPKGAKMAQRHQKCAPTVPHDLPRHPLGPLWAPFWDF